ncbi:MAG: hypothetical protein KGI06_05645 [Candidatus Micrarchaeota archaeon]|nr:hypothetical protein [Candidatus Micrarchaeota archaeon]
MDGTKQKKVYNPKLRDGTDPGREVFVLKFRTEEDRRRVIGVLRETAIGCFNQQKVGDEVWASVSKEAVIELNKHKDLQDKYMVG